MLSAGSVMAPGIEQANVLQVTSFPSGAKGMSFSKSFGESVAVLVGLNKGAVDGLLLSSKENSKESLPPANGDAAAGSGGKAGGSPSGLIAKVPGDRSPSDAETNVASSSVLNVPGVVDAAVEITTKRDSGAALSAGGLAVGCAKGADNSPVSVTEKTVEDELYGAPADIAKGGAIRVVSEAPTAPCASHASELCSESSGAMKDIGMKDATKAVLALQAVYPPGEQPLAMEKGGKHEPQRQMIGVVKSGVVITTKKEKIKGSGAASTADAKTGAPVSDGSQTGAPIGMPSGIDRVAAEPIVRGKSANDDPGPAAPSGLVPAPGRAKMPAPDGKPRVRAGAAVGRQETKDGGALVAPKGGEVLGQEGRAGNDHTKTAVAVISASNVETGKTQGTGGTVTVPMTHGVVSASRDDARDAVAAKSHATAVPSSMANVQDGSGAGHTGDFAMEEHKTLSATPTSLEVGIANGTHGWLKVRAEMTSGGMVNASLSAASSAGQEMLHRELPTLTAYLQDERIGVNAVSLHAGTSAAESGQLTGGMEGDAGRGQMQQNARQGGDADRQGADRSAFFDHPESAAALKGQNGLENAGWLSPAIYAGGLTGGSWLSVRA